MAPSPAARGKEATLLQREPRLGTQFEVPTDEPSNALFKRGDIVQLTGYDSDGDPYFVLIHAADGRTAFPGNISWTVRPHQLRELPWDRRRGVSSPLHHFFRPVDSPKELYFCVERSSDDDWVLATVWDMRSPVSPFLRDVTPRELGEKYFIEARDMVSNAYIGPRRIA